MEYTSLSNAQNIGRAVAIYRHGKDLPVPDEPTLVILVGSPAVGKTTQARRILAEQGMDYENFYNVSLDSLAETTQPYRNATRAFYEEYAKRKPNARVTGPVPPTEIHPIHENMGKFSGFYTTVTQSQRNNFGMTESLRGAVQRLNTPGYKPSSANKRKANTEFPINKTKLTLIDVREEAFKVGLQQGYDIIYDTTFKSDTSKFREIINTVQQNASKKYKIMVVHVTAPQGDVEARMRGRQEGMIMDPEKAIRGIPFKMTWMFIKDNSEGYNKVKEYVTSGEVSSDFPTFSPEDFTFLQADNPTKGGRRLRSQTKKRTKSRRGRTLKNRP